MRDDDKGICKIVADEGPDRTSLCFARRVVFDQRMSLTSIMAHPGIDLVGLDAGTLRDIFIEMFSNPRTTFYNPLLKHTGQELHGDL